MKNQFFLLIFFLGITIPSWTQVSSGKVTYKVTMDEKMTDSILNQEDMMPELRSYLSSMYDRQVKTLPHLFYQLEFTAQESHFYTSNTMQNDNNIDLEKTAKNVKAYGNYYINLEGQ